jgi:enamine deaminase RidA (YjgF/YER057c/UK114 family)
MAIRRIGIKQHLSLGVVHGDTVYLAGQVARTGDTVREQTADILAQIDELLAEAGTDKSNLLTANIWLTDISTFPEMNEAWSAARPRHS